MFNLYNVSSTVILMGTLIYIAKQTNIQKKDLEMRINYQKREKAIEMAKVFSELIDKTILVSEVLKNLEAINKINISDSDYNHLNYFDEDELKKLFDEDDLGKIKSEINIENIGLEKYISAYAITGDSSLNKFKDEIIFLINEKFLRNEKTKQEYDKMDIIIKREISKTMVELLNQIEGLKQKYPSIQKVHFVASIPSCLSIEIGKRFALNTHRLPQIISYHFVNSGTPKYPFGIIVSDGATGKGKLIKG